MGNIYKRQELIRFEKDNTEISNLQDMVGKYVQIRGHFHPIVEVIPVDDDKYIIHFAAGSEGAIGGEFEPATEEEIKSLQLYKQVEESNKIQESITSGSLEDAIKMLDYTYDKAENLYEQTEEVDKKDINEICNYVGTALDVLRELNDKGVYVPDKKKTESIEDINESQYYVKVFDNGTDINYMEFAQQEEADDFCKQQVKDGYTCYVYDMDTNEAIEEYNSEDEHLTEAKTDVDSAVETIMSLHKDGNEEELDEQWLNDDIQLTIQNTEELANAITNNRRPTTSVAYQGLLQALNNRSEVPLTGNQIQAAFKKLGLDFKQVIKPTVDWLNEEREELKQESKATVEQEVVEENKELTEDMEAQNITINPEDSDYYEEKFLVTLNTGVNADSGLAFEVYANDEQQALEILVPYLEENYPGYLIDCEDVDPEESQYIYVDGTEYGATKPYCLDIYTGIQYLEEGYTITNDTNLDAIKDNFTPPGGDKIEEAEDDISDTEGVEEEEDEDKTLLDYLQDRIGQKLSVGELNTILQSLFAQYGTVFLQVSDLYDMDIDEPQELVVWDDADMYVITYNIIDLIDEPTIEITDVTLD